MTSAPIPDDEEARLAGLRSAQILDSPAERYFDDIVKLAQLICDVPIALVSLVDADRQWFKARIGMAVAETPRDQSFCAHALTQRDALVIPDTSGDPRFVDNPLVESGPKIRSYAGVPIFLDEGGAAVGTLCVLDRVPRQLSGEQLAALAALARARGDGAPPAQARHHHAEGRPGTSRPPHRGLGGHVAHGRVEARGR